MIKYCVGEKEFKTLKEAEDYEKMLATKKSEEEKKEKEMKEREQSINDLIDNCAKEIDKFEKDFGMMPCISFNLGNKKLDLDFSHFDLPMSMLNFFD